MKKIKLAVIITALAPFLCITRGVADSTCQLTITLGSQSYPTNYYFTMNSQTNILQSPSTQLVSGSQIGDYRGDIAEFNLPDSYTTIKFNPQTNKAIDVTTLGVIQSIASSSLNCQPALAPPSCSEYVTNLYQTILGRAPDPGGYTGWVNQCASGVVSRDQIMADFYKSSEFANDWANNLQTFDAACNAFITDFYNEFLYRDPDSSGGPYWYGQCIAGGPSGLGNIVQEIINSPEYASLHQASSNVCSAAPGAPGPLSASSVSSDEVKFSWTAASAPPGCAITGYTVYENGTAVQTIQGTSFDINELSPSTSYAFTVAANDSAGSSPQSSALSVTTQSVGQMVATSITNLCPDTQSYVDLVDYTLGEKGNLTSVCIGDTNVSSGQTVNVQCPVPTQAQGNGYGVWQANFTNQTTGATQSNPNSQGSSSGFVLLNATEVNATLEADCKTVQLAYTVAQGTGNTASITTTDTLTPAPERASSAGTANINAVPTPARLTVDTGAAPDVSYSAVTSPAGQAKLKAMVQAAQSGAPINVKSTAYTPHDVTAQ